MEKNNFKKYIEGKNILVTGGTGSFGNAAVTKLLHMNPKEIVIFSRDEKKQFDMMNRFNDGRLKFILGDVRNEESVNRVMYKIDYVFHAAALKQVPTGEFFPLEVIKTNSLGAHNVIEAAIRNKVKRLVILSTDKAVHPINAMGMSKALMEKIMVATSREKRGSTVLCGVRYGNVLCTRGSVIPYFIELMKSGKPITITNKKMTRFLMPLDHSIDLVLYALAKGENGDIYVRKAPSSTIDNLTKAIVEIFNYKKEIKEIGIRLGEKIHEELVSSEEVPRTTDCGNYFKISPESPNMDYGKYFIKGIKRLPDEGYNSSNTKKLNIEEVKKLLLSLEEIKKEIKNYTSLL